jgi:hypothetical protein
MTLGHRGHGGADPLVCGRPPVAHAVGPPPTVRSAIPFLRAKSGSRGTRADQGVCPTVL